MTIRRSVNIATINTDFTYFLEGCENAPAGMYTQALDIRDRVLGYVADEFLRVARSSGLETCNCDGIREIECMMFAMIREKNPDSQIGQAIGLGRALEHASEPGSAVTRSDILARLRSDRAFVQSQRDAAVDALLEAVGGPTETAASLVEQGATIAATVAPTTYQVACDALTQGPGDLWLVRVENSFDEMDYVDLEVRAEIMEDAAVKAEAHAAAYKDMYFDIGAEPTFGAVRRDIYRIGEDGEEIDDSEERFAGSDAPFPGQEA